MCGIAGIFNLNGEPISPVALRRMTDSIAHRGPDGEGFYNDRFIGLGHRRLAIIDLSGAGHQPMVSRDNQVALSYNGEIYNFQELRLELEALGHVFRSKTDSEVVLNAWVEWGKESVKKFNGMFAFAVWDKRCQSLFLVRDRYGIKPLYYAQWGKTFLFGSEQKAILAHQSAERNLDTKALLEYMTFQNIFTDRTLLKGVKILSPATIAEVSLGSEENIKSETYWDYRFREPEGRVDERAYREELDRLMQQAVKRQLVTDVEIGSYLSGGMDSGTLTAIAGSELPYIKTFTCGFDLSSASGLELSFDERTKAEALSALFKTEHYEMVLKAGDMERCLPTLAHHIEEPRVGQSYPNYYVAKLASKFVKVVLSGAGGDELFGGYPWRYYRATVCNGFEDYIDKYYLYWQRMVDNRDLNRMFEPVRKDVSDVWTRDIFRDVFRTHDNELRKAEDYVNHSLYFEAKTFLHGLFVVEDKLSMAHSLETRVPFMDNDLVDFAMSCPVNLKLNNLQKVIRINENDPGNKQDKFFQRTRDGKQILRDVMKSYIPESVTKAEKQGFSAPDASWFKGESIEFVRRTLLDPKAKLYNWLDRSVVHSLVQEHLSGEKNRRLLVWSLINLECWLEDYLGN
ncbi:asparagine synthase (glutamine-hydrolyzing) [Verrucomicrobia bacterium]|nr:asparagine synthase (glutamine-hydrolyzing) [Verrucomicrobiota bacterium]MDA7657481.1 asparagine synthase (glutamine-hydrolyzing) [Verrucomicrobiota bacterium]